MTTTTTTTCDRCGVEQPEGERWGYVQLLTPMPSAHPVYGDLCPACTRAVEAYIRSSVTR